MFVRIARLIAIFVVLSAAGIALAAPQIRIAALGNYDMPYGRYFDGLGHGTGRGAEMTLAWNPRTSLVIAVADVSLEKVRGHLEPDGPLDPVVLENRTTLDATRVVVAMEAERSFAPGSALSPLFYVRLGAGAIKHEFAVTYVYEHDEVHDDEPERHHRDSVQPLTSMGLGLIVRPLPVLGVMVSADADAIFMGTSLTTDLAWMLSLHAGAVVCF